MFWSKLLGLIWQVRDVYIGLFHGDTIDCFTACHLKTDNFKRALYYSDEVREQNSVKLVSYSREFSSFDPSGSEEKPD